MHRGTCGPISGASCVRGYRCTTWLSNRLPSISRCSSTTGARRRRGRGRDDVQNPPFCRRRSASFPRCRCALRRHQAPEVRSKPPSDRGLDHSGPRAPAQLELRIERLGPIACAVQRRSSWCRHRRHRRAPRPSLRSRRKRRAPMLLHARLASSSCHCTPSRQRGPPDAQGTRTRAGRSRGPKAAAATRRPRARHRRAWSRRDRRSAPLPAG